MTNITSTELVSYRQIVSRNLWSLFFASEQIYQTLLKVGPSFYVYWIFLPL